MLNIEKHQNELKKIGVDAFSVVDGMPNYCFATNCNECSLKGAFGGCKEARIYWLIREYNGY